MEDTLDTLCPKCGAQVTLWLQKFASGIRTLHWQCYACGAHEKQDLSQTEDLFTIAKWMSHEGAVRKKEIQQRLVAGRCPRCNGEIGSEVESGKLLWACYSCGGKGEVTSDLLTKNLRKAAEPRESSYNYWHNFIWYHLGALFAIIGPAFSGGKIWIINLPLLWAFSFALLGRWLDVFSTIIVLSSNAVTEAAPGLGPKPKASVLLKLGISQSILLLGFVSLILFLGRNPLWDIIGLGLCSVVAIAGIAVGISNLWIGLWASLAQRKSSFDFFHLKDPYSRGLDVRPYRSLFPPILPAILPIISIAGRILSMAVSVICLAYLCSLITGKFYFEGSSLLWALGWGGLIGLHQFIFPKK